MQRSKPYTDHDEFIEEYNQDMNFIEGDAFAEEEYEWWLWVISELEKRKSPVEEREYIDFEEVNNNKGAELPF